MSDQCIHNPVLCQVCDLAGPEPRTAISFQDVNCPICASRGGLVETAMTRIEADLVADARRTIARLPSDDPLRLHIRQLLEDAGHITPEQETRSRGNEITDSCPCEGGQKGYVRILNSSREGLAHGQREVQDLRPRGRGRRLLQLARRGHHGQGPQLLLRRSAQETSGAPGKPPQRQAAASSSQQRLFR